MRVQDVNQAFVDAKRAERIAMAEAAIAYCEPEAARFEAAASSVESAKDAVPEAMDPRGEAKQRAKRMRGHVATARADMVRMAVMPQSCPPGECRCRDRDNF